MADSCHSRLDLGTPETHIGNAELEATPPQAISSKWVLLLYGANPGVQGEQYTPRPSVDTEKLRTIANALHENDMKCVVFNVTKQRQLGPDADSAWARFAKLNLFLQDGIIQFTGKLPSLDDNKFISHNPESIRGAIKSCVSTFGMPSLTTLSDSYVINVNAIEDRCIRVDHYAIFRETANECLTDIALTRMAAEEKTAAAVKKAKK